MSHILWLASYPKSGNTWLRAFMANFILNPAKPLPINELPKFGYGDMIAYPYEKLLGGPLDDRTEDEIFAVRPQAHRIIANFQPGIVFVKTHNRLTSFEGVPSITPDVTFGAIYVIRNPLDVMISFANQYGRTIDESIAASGEKNQYLPRIEGLIPQFLGDWSGHVRTWTQASGLFLLVLRYEDMLAQPTKSFGKIVKFLSIPKNVPRLNKAIRFSNFKELSTQEKRGGFCEASTNAERFFRQGKAGGWRKTLTPRQIDRIIDLHGEVMKEYGYLNDKGIPKI